MTIWVGQLVSMFGSRMTGFAISVWIYQQTGSVTKYSFMLLATILPEILVSPLAGALVDRLDRRWVMILSDAVSALSTLVMAVLLLAGSLELWTLALLRAIASTCDAFQVPAYFASMPLMVPKARLGQLNGLIQLGSGVQKIAAPALAGVLVALVQIWGVLLIDFATFLVALGTLLAVRVPKPERDEEARSKEGSWLREASAGWQYLKARPGLMAILFLLMGNFFVLGIFDVSAPTLILSFASVTSMGALIAVASIGALAGSLAMTVWGKPERLVRFLVGFNLPLGLGLILVGVAPSLVVVGTGGFLITFSIPMIWSCGQTLWQTKIPPYLQGRVFALRSVATSVATVSGYLLAGPLADRVLEPLLAADGPLAGSVGRVVGVGPGRGIGLMLMLAGALTLVLAACLSPRVRRAEEDLPDVLTGEPMAEGRRDEPRGGSEIPDQGALSR